MKRPRQSATACFVVGVRRRQRLGPATAERISSRIGPTTRPPGRLLPRKRHRTPLRRDASDSSTASPRPPRTANEWFRPRVYTCVWSRAGAACTRLAGAVLVLLMAACGSPPIAVEIAGPTASGTAGTGRDSAEREAARLFALVVPPAGATPVSSAPGLAGPFMSPGADSLVDVAHLWRLDMTFAQARTWLAEQHPGGLEASATPSSSDRGGVTLDSRTYDPPIRPEFDSTQLQLAVVAGGGTSSYLHADGLVVWLDPTPYADDMPGARIRVAAGGPCPITDEGAVGVRNPDQQDLDVALVPAGTPTGGLLCRYQGSSGQEGALDAQRALDRDDATRLTTAARRVRLAHPVGALSLDPWTGDLEDLDSG